MNQGRIWCVVNPTVGLPLFIGGVAVTSLIVHYAILSHTTWMGNYWQGKAAKVAMVDPAADKAKLAELAPPARPVQVASAEQK
jgi:light-harvesting protein B-800-850 alpha chain